MLTTRDAPKAKIVKVNLKHPEQTSWTQLVPESRNSLESVSMVHEELILSYLVDAKSEVEVRGLDGAMKQKLAPAGDWVRGDGRRKTQRGRDVLYVYQLHDAAHGVPA